MRDKETAAPVSPQPIIKDEPDANAVEKQPPPVITNNSGSEQATTTTISSLSSEPAAPTVNGNGKTSSSQDEDGEYVLPSKQYKNTTDAIAQTGNNGASDAANTRRTSYCGNGSNNGYARSRLFRAPHDALVPSFMDDSYLADGSVASGSLSHSLASGLATGSWQLLHINLHRAYQTGFGIAISGGRDNPHFVSGDPSIAVSDVIESGPAFGLVQINDRIVSANGVNLENADYAMAVAVMKDAEQLNMIVKRRVPVPFVEFEQRTLKFTLSKSRKKDDFGIVLGCKFYIKEITNPKLAEKDPGLKEGDTVLRVNGQTLEGVTLEEAARLLHRSREKLSLVVQRDVRRGSTGSRWPSQTTVYERLGSVSVTPRHSPTPVHYTQSAASNVGSLGNNQPSGSSSQQVSSLQHNSRKLPADYSPGPKRFSDPMTSSRLEGGFPSPGGPHYGRQFGGPVGQQPSNNSPQPFPNTNSVQYQRNSSPAAHPNNGHRATVQSDQYPYGAQPGSRAGQPHQFFLYNQQQSSVYPPQSQTPTSSIISASSAAGSPRNFPPASGAGNYAYYNQQFPQTHSQANNFGGSIGSVGNSSQASRDVKHITFNKGTAGSLGIRVIGGNQAGIFVSAVQGDSPAALNGIRVGDRIHSVDGHLMNGVTREEAVEHLLALPEEVNICVEHNAEEFAHMKSGQVGDSYYIRTHFPYQKRSNNKQELSFQSGDIFHVTDSLCGGTVGYWQVTKIYSVSESDAKNQDVNGVIPNGKTAEVLAKQARMDSSTIGRSIFRKRLQSRRTKSLTTTAAEDEFLSGAGNANFSDIPLPAYERVALKKPAFHRPVVLYGPLADVARQLLLSNFSLRFGAPFDQQQLNEATGVDSSQRIIRMSSIDSIMASHRHCVLSISPGSVERLQLAQYAPIVILIDVESRSRIRELRSKAGTTTLSARKLMEQASKLKKHHAHLLTATLDASKEDGWFEALRQLIFHLQERRVWMPEFQPTQPIEDLLLFPMQNCNLAETPDADSNKADYGIYDATGSGASSVQATPAHRQNLVESLPTAGSIGGGVYAGHGGSGSLSTHTPSGSNSPFFAAFARNSPYSHSYRNTYGSDNRPNAGQMLPPQGVNGGGQPAGYYDVKQILAEHYPESTTTNTSMNSVIQNPGSVDSRLSASSPYKSQQQSQPIAIPRQSLQPQHHIAEPASIRSPGRARSEANSQLNDISMLTYDAPYIDDPKQRNPSPFRFTDVDDFENNNQLATTTLNVNLSPSSPGANYQSEVMSPKRHAATSNIRSSTDPIVIEHVNGVFDWKGGSLRCPESGVELSVPESAIPFGLQQELFVKVCRENQQNPPLDTEKQESLMSPLVMCGPQGVTFQVPVELKLPHNSTKASDPAGTSSPANFVLKSGSGANWRNIEVVKPPETSDKFVTVLVNHF